MVELDHASSAPLALCVILLVKLGVRNTFYDDHSD